MVFVFWLGRNFRAKDQYDEMTVPDDGKEANFRSLFPFSFFLGQLLESMRPTSEGAGEGALAHQVEKLLNLGMGLSGELEERVLQRYVHDVICMRFSPIDKISRAEQAKMVWHLLAVVEEGSSPKTLAAVHYRLWRIER